MAMICCQKTNFLRSWVARQKAVICGQDGLFKLLIEHFSFVKTRRHKFEQLIKTNAK